MPGPDVMGPAELAKALGGVTRQRVAQIRAQWGDEFPPYTQLEIGRVYDGPAVRAFQITRTEPRRRKMSRMLNSYVQTGIVAQAARAAGVSDQTARTWLREIGKPLPRDSR